MERNQSIGSGPSYRPSFSPSYRLLHDNLLFLQVFLINFGFWNLNFLLTSQLIQVNVGVGATAHWELLMKPTTGATSSPPSGPDSLPCRSTLHSDLSLVIWGLSLPLTRRNSCPHFGHISSSLSKVAWERASQGLKHLGTAWITRKNKDLWALSRDLGRVPIFLFIAHVTRQVT